MSWLAWERKHSCRRSTRNHGREVLSGTMHTLLVRSDLTSRRHTPVNDGVVRSSRAACINRRDHSSLWGRQSFPRLRPRKHERMDSLEGLPKDIRRESHRHMHRQEAGWWLSAHPAASIPTSEIWGRRDAVDGCACSAACPLHARHCGMSLPVRRVRCETVDRKVQTEKAK